MSCKLSTLETICMKCQNMLSGKNKKKILTYCLLKILPRVLSVKYSVIEIIKIKLTKPKINQTPT